MSKISEIVSGLAGPVAAQFGCGLWDVEYVKEAGQWYLRVYIDKEGGVSIEDCENVSRALDPILDEKDPIAESYIFEVSSAGLERSLKKPEHFPPFIGKTVEVKLYSPLNGSKSYTGELAAYRDGDITLRREDGELTFEKQQIANVHVSLI